MFKKKRLLRETLFASILLICLSAGIPFIGRIVIQYLNNIFNITEFLNITIPFFALNSHIVKIHFVGGVIPVIISLVMFFIAFFKIRERDYLLKFFGPVILSILVSHIITEFFSFGIGVRDWKLFLTMPLLVLFPIFLLKNYKMLFNQLLIPFTTYASTALGIFIDDLYSLPSYLNWLISQGCYIGLTLGGGSFLDGLFAFSLVAFLTSIIVLKFYNEFFQACA